MRQGDSDANTVTCTDVIIDVVDPNNPTVTIDFAPEDYQNDAGKKPGTYCVTFTATNLVDETNLPAQSDTSQYCFELVDPCNPPDSVTAPTLVDQAYTISDPTATPYTHPAFVISPDYCEIRLNYEETKFTDDGGDLQTAITRVDDTFSFFYGADLSPVKPTAQT